MFFKKFLEALAEAYLEPDRISKMKFFMKLVNDSKSFTIYAKNFIFVVWLSSQCISGLWQNLAYHFSSNFCCHKHCYFTINSVDCYGWYLVVGGLRGVRFVFYLLIFTVMLFYRVCCRFKQMHAQVLLALLLLGV